MSRNDVIAAIPFGAGISIRGSFASRDRCAGMAAGGQSADACIVRLSDDKLRPGSGAGLGSYEIPMETGFARQPSMN